MVTGLKAIGQGIRKGVEKDIEYQKLRAETEGFLKGYDKSFYTPNKFAQYDLRALLGERQKVEGEITARTQQQAYLENIATAHEIQENQRQRLSWGQNLQDQIKVEQTNIPGVTAVQVKGGEPKFIHTGTGSKKRMTFTSPDGSTYTTEEGPGLDRVLGGDLTGGAKTRFQKDQENRIVALQKGVEALDAVNVWTVGIGGKLVNTFNQVFGDLSSTEKERENERQKNVIRLYKETAILDFAGEGKLGQYMKEDLRKMLADSDTWTVGVDQNVQKIKTTLKTLLFKWDKARQYLRSESLSVPSTLTDVSELDRAFYNQEISLEVYAFALKEFYPERVIE